MATTTFYPGQTPIVSDWLNDVDAAIYAASGTDTGALQSNQLGYTPAGTGAVATTVQAKLRESVSVKDFGAVGDGVTDDTDAIQAAINYVKTSTSRLTVDLVGAGYLISQALVINQGDCGIANGKLIADAVNFSDDGSGQSGSEAMLRVRQGLRITVDNIDFECNAVADGIACETNGFANIYRHLEISDCKTFGILLDTDSDGDQRIINCLLTGNATPSLRTGTTGLLINTGDVKVENTTVRYFGINMDVDGSTLLCSDCHFYNGYAGADAGEITANYNSVNIRIVGGSGQTFSGCYIDKGRVVLKDKFANHWVSNRYLFKSDGSGHASVFLFDAVDSVSKEFPEDWVHTSGFSIAPIDNGVTPFIQLNATGTGSWSGSVSTIVSTMQASGLMPDAKGVSSALLPRAAANGYLGLNNLRWKEVNAVDLSCNSIDVNSKNPEVIISAGEVTVTESFHKVDTESSASTDDLDTINGGRDGQILILVASSGSRTVVIKNGTGNIACGADVTLDTMLDTATLIYDSAQSMWLLISSSNNS